MTPPLDPAISKALGKKPEQIKLNSKSSMFSQVGQLDTDAGSYFLKVSDQEAMIMGEAESYKAINAAVSGFCPQVIASGRCEDSEMYFIITTLLDFQTPSSESLASNLVKLHSTTGEEGYGFPVATCCADTAQDNTWTTSWTLFFVQRRLRPIALLGANASDRELADLVEAASTKVIPKLLDSLDIQPTLIHGDLWSGNQRNGKVFDSCACYAHSEFELSIMHMFGGLTTVLNEYHALKAKDEPIAEYGDRQDLYMVYHQLNHSGTGQGSSYKESAKQTLRRLVVRYGNSEHSG